MNPSLPDGPIPGEHLLKDSRDFPWHSPADISDFDDALEYVSRDLDDNDLDLKYIHMMKKGVSVAAITDIICTKGIADGKWTPDLALVIAGPVARMIEIMAKGYEIDYDLGVEKEVDLGIGSLMGDEDIQSISEDINEDLYKEDTQQVQEINVPTEGILSRPSPDEVVNPVSLEEQDRMLGGGL